MPKETLYDRLQLYLFEDNDNIHVSERFNARELKIKRRIMDAFTFCLDKPALSNRKIINYIRSTHKVCRRTAYYDLEIINPILEFIRNPNKTWQLFRLMAMLDEANRLALKEKDPTLLIKSADILGKYNKLDKECIDEISRDEIIPAPFEPTGDVSVLGIRPFNDLQGLKRKLREKYSVDIPLSKENCIYPGEEIDNSILP